MTFASAIFLSGLIAVSVPIAIHLLARQRTRTLSWGAMEFLRNSVSSATARRQRLRDILLLMLRVLAIVFVVLTFAQPLVSQLLLGGSQLETVFIWDVSLSTTAISDDDQPLAAAMKASLLEELDRLPDQSRVRILVAGAESRWLKPHALTLTPANREALRIAIEDQPAESGQSNLPNAILRALSLEEDPNAHSLFREIAIVHDYQRYAWDEQAEHWAVIQDRLAMDASQSLRQVDPRARLDQNRPQVAVSQLMVSRDTVAPESPARMRATVRNESPDVTARGDIVWSIDGREVERSEGIELAAGGELKLEQVMTFESLGCHLVACTFESDRDQLPIDNRAVCVVSAQEALPVLVIDDTELTQRGQIRPAEFLVASLGGSLMEKVDDRSREIRRSQPGAKSLFAPRVIRSDQWRGEILENQLAVFIVAAQQLSDAAIAELQTFVRQGGGLWLILDSRQESLREWEVSLLEQLGLQSLTDTSQTDADGRLPFNLKVANSKSSFADGIVAPSLDLHRAEIRSLHRINDGVVLRDERLLETVEGMPILLSLSIGKGRVLLQTTDLSRTNTNLPILQSFVPFVREIARETAASSLPKWNLAQGDSFRVTTTRVADFLGAPALSLPDDSSAPMQLQGAAYESHATMLPGIYKVYDSQIGQPEKATEYFAVARPPAESRLQPLPQETLEALLKPQAGETGAAAGQSKGKWPLAFWFAVVAAGLFLTEALLARWIARTRAQRTSRLDLRPVF